MKISIVVPVYNVEKYIENCLRSLLEQDLPADEYEIIIINDGSRDNSEAIIKKYIDKHTNIIYVKQSNRGVSAARNAALDIARGEYVFFVDSDDSLYPNVLQRLYNRLIDDRLDLLYVRLESYNENGEHVDTFKIDGGEEKILDGFHHLRRGFIAALYRNELIKNIRFTEGILVGEDALFNLMVHANAKRCSYSDLKVYKYLVRNVSASRLAINTNAAFTGYLKIIEIVKAYRDENQNKFTDQEYRYFERPIIKTSELALKSNIIPTYSFQRYRVLLDVLRRNGYDYLSEEIAIFVPHFGKNKFVFFGYHAVKKLYVKLKS